MWLPPTTPFLGAETPWECIVFPDRMVRGWGRTRRPEETRVDRRKMAIQFLRAVGVLLIALGAVHLAATPHIPGLLRGSPRAVYQQALGPTLLNHVLVGILLLPLGYTTWLAAAGRARGEWWATRVLVANTVVMFTLPLSVAIFMRRPEYYKAPLFLTGVGLVAVISLLMVAATCVLRAPGAGVRKGSTPPR